MKRFGFLIALTLCLPSPADAATLALSRTTRQVLAEEIADGAPAGGFVHEFFVSSDSDLLCVGADPFGASLFNHSLGSDVAPPAPADVFANPALGTSSFIALPSETSMLGGGFSAASGERAWFDLSNDGPQQSFMFARLTTTGQTASFTGTIYAWGYDAPVPLPFSFVLPGTEGDLALLEAEPNYSLEYSLDPPPAPVPPPVVPALPPPPEPPPIIPPSVVDATPNPVESYVPPAPPIAPEAPPLPEIQEPGDILIGGQPDQDEADQDLGEFVSEIRNGFTVPLIWSKLLRVGGDAGLFTPTMIDLTAIDGGVTRFGAVDGTTGIADLRALANFTVTDDALPTLMSTSITRLTGLAGRTGLNYADGLQPPMLHAAFVQERSTPIPEPSAALLAAVAWLGLRAARRR